MLFYFINYVKFLWNSKNEHGTHSPFVYQLLTKVFYDKSNFKKYDLLNRHQLELLNSNEFITINDFGSGSKVFNSNIRKVKQIAKTSGISAKRARLLFRITNYFQPNNILELGTSLGLATYAMNLGNPNAEIYTVEGCENILKNCKLHFDPNNINQITFINNEFSNFLSSHNIKDKKFDMIYFDGNHSKKATLEYFNSLLPTINNESYWIFDDINWSKDMNEAWQIIKNHPKVSVSIDTFQWGIVFFRKEQAKENFVIRV